MTTEHSVIFGAFPSLAARLEAAEAALVECAEWAADINGDYSAAAIRYAVADYFQAYRTQTVTLRHENGCLIATPVNEGGK